MMYGQDAEQAASALPSIDVSIRDNHGLFKISLDANATVLTVKDTVNAFFYSPDIKKFNLVVILKMFETKGGDFDLKETVSDALADSLTLKTIMNQYGSKIRSNTLRLRIYEVNSDSRAHNFTYVAV